MAIVITDDFITLDECNDTTGWAGSTDATSPALDTTIYKKGTASIQLGKSGTSESFIYYEKSFASTDITNSIMVVWLYVKTQDALDKINKDDIRLYFYDSAGNWAYWQFPLRDLSNHIFSSEYLKVGWNVLRCTMGASYVVARGNRADSTYVGGSSATYPDITDLVKVRLYIPTNNATDTITQGDLLMDYWHYGTKLYGNNLSDSPSNFASFYQHSEDNALGVADRLAPETYHFFCELQEDGYFTDYSSREHSYSSIMTIIFDTRATPQTWWWYFRGSNYVQFGKITDSTTKTTEKGINFTSIGGRYWNHGIYRCNYYSCSFQGTMMYLRNAQNMWNCFGQMRLHTPEGDFYNVYSVNAMECTTPTANYEKVTLNSPKGYMTRPYQSQHLTKFKNCYIYNNSYFNSWCCIAAEDITTIAINQVTGTRNDYYYSSATAGCYQYWCFTVNMRFVDEDGNPLEGVSVEIKDKNGGIISRNDSGATLQIDLGGGADNTGMTVSDASKFDIGDIIMMDNELMTVTATNPTTNTLSVTRGTRYNITHHYTGEKIYIIGSAISDSNGEIDEQLLTESYNSVHLKNAFIFYTPHTFLITKKGYKTYTWEGNISEKIDWEITLKPYTSDAPEGIATTINDDSISASISEDSISATVSEDAIASSVSEDKITATISEDNISVEVKD